MTPHKGQKALHPLLVGMCVGTFPPMAGNQQAAGPGHEEVKCQEQNVNSCWQAMQKTCSLRLREPWYFTKSNEHVSQHCRATIGLFKEEAQKAGRCYVTCRRDCFSCSSAGKALLWLRLLSSFHSLAPPVSHRRVPQWDTMTMRHERTHSGSRCTVITKLLRSHPPGPLLDPDPARYLSQYTKLPRTSCGPQPELWLAAGQHQDSNPLHPGCIINWKNKDQSLDAWNRWLYKYDIRVYCENVIWTALVPHVFCITMIEEAWLCDCRCRS